MTLWSYQGDNGPEAWGRLTLPGTDQLAYPDCNGDRQSPIAIPPGTPVIPTLVLDYSPTSIRITDTWLLKQVDCGPGSTLTLDGERFDLAQFHFHAPGEHNVDGSFSAIEAHFVHQSRAGVRAVVAVLIDPGVANTAFEPVLAAMHTAPGQPEADENVNPRDLLPSDLAHYAYEGSLTMPPCTEGVLWRVLAQRVTASPEQIKRFRALPFLNVDSRFIGNVRPVQPLNGRFQV